MRVCYHVADMFRSVPRGLCHTYAKMIDFDFITFAYPLMSKRTGGLRWCINCGSKPGKKFEMT